MNQISLFSPKSLCALTTSTSTQWEEGQLTGLFLIVLGSAAVILLWTLSYLHVYVRF
jgi:hypothetical protein